GGSLRGPAEPNNVVWLRQGASQYLQCHDSIERKLTGSVHDPHSAGANPALDAKVTNLCGCVNVALTHRSRNRHQKRSGSSLGERMSCYPSFWRNSTVKWA